MIGLGKADKVLLLQIDWPTSGTTQVFRDVAADQTVEITEFEASYRRVPVRPIVLPD